MESRYVADNQPSPVSRFEHLGPVGVRLPHQIAVSFIAYVAPDGICAFAGAVQALATSRPNVV